MFTQPCSHSARLPRGKRLRCTRARGSPTSSSDAQLPERPTSVYYNDKHFAIVPMPIGEPFMQLQAMEAVTVLNAASAVLNMSRLDRSQFVALGNKEGACVNL